MTLTSLRFAVTSCLAICTLMAAPAALAQVNSPVGTQVYMLELSGDICEAVFSSDNSAMTHEYRSGELKLECLDGVSTGEWTITNRSVTFTGVNDPLNVLNQDNCPNGWQNIRPNQTVHAGELCWVNWSAGVEAVVRVE
ncbi:hypothetical protein [Ponticaulis sp.]|uniref:hypothetical protein n=1 Tax=Ponticaulis sp. TaxID=2020902 RepID=UPI000B65383C|nr:hypothetical protein [Ponticaulis sp.]MAI91915.1 hypothetical protein [Ponticaulis sp.]OUX96591.1 MAG: hypothetical protein CBB65_15905 [Hyphomonadaceae bacterium TMED5]|tara:strand:- start:30549 stop:30965 length:417 start_codon:yes stop_codon:yes gene_type:complete